MLRLQMALTAYGFFALALMIATVAAAFAERGGTPLRPLEGGGAGVYANWGAFGLAVSTFVFAQLMHHGVPQLVHLVRDKRRMKPVFVATFGSTLVFYVVLGVLTVRLSFSPPPPIPTTHMWNTR